MELGHARSGSQPGCIRAVAEGLLPLRQGLFGTLLPLEYAGTLNCGSAETRNSRVDRNQRSEGSDRWLGALNLGLVMHRQCKSENGAVRLARKRNAVRALLQATPIG